MRSSCERTAWSDEPRPGLHLNSRRLRSHAAAVSPRAEVLPPAAGAAREMILPFVQSRPAGSPAAQAAATWPTDASQRDRPLLD